MHVGLTLQKVRRAMHQTSEQWQRARAQPWTGSRLNTAWGFSWRLLQHTHQAQHLLCAQQLLARRQLHPLLRHAVQAAQVASLRQADAQVRVAAPGGKGGRRAE